MNISRRRRRILYLFLFGFHNYGDALFLLDGISHRGRFSRLRFEMERQITLKLSGDLQWTEDSFSTFDRFVKRINIRFILNVQIFFQFTQPSRKTNVEERDRAEQTTLTEVLSIDLSGQET